MPHGLYASATEKHLLRLGVLFATVMFVAGAALPMMTLHQLVVFDQSFSVIAGVVELFVTILILGYEIHSLDWNRDLGLLLGWSG
jgi:predicted Co/Zn/Cd cation transporter (cation efflux family)